MANRTSFATVLLLLVAHLGCTGVSGRRFYEENAPHSRGLNEIVDCPTCPSGYSGHDAIVEAAPRAEHDDRVIPPHAKFHPVPTRPVFAPKVARGPTFVAAAPPKKLPTLALASATENVVESVEPVAAIEISSDEAPAPPMAKKVASKPTSRSVLVRTTTIEAEEKSMPSVLVRSSTKPPALIEHTDATPLPTLADEVPAVAPTPAVVPVSARTKSAGDGWRPRVGN